MLLSLLPLLLALTAPPVTPPPAAPMLWLATNTFHANRPGGGSSASGKALVLNTPSLFVTYSMPRLCGFSAGGGFTKIDPAAQLGWSVTVTPKAITTDHVVLDVSWVRERNHKPEAQGASVVLIRPGDTVPLDVADTPEASQVSGCRMTSAELTLELDPVSFGKISPGRGSVVSTDLWLVRRLADGKEDTQQINVRGALNEEVPFYFDDVKSGEMVTSVLGKIRAREREGGAIALEFEAARLVRMGNTPVGRGFTSLPPGAGPLVFETAQDVLSVQFPRSTDPKWMDLGSEGLSIRIRTRRIR